MRARILLVTDAPETGKIWVYALSEMGPDVTMVDSPAEASVRWFGGEVFDMVLIDAYTPRLDSIDLCRRLREVAVNPILLLTDRAEEGHILEAYRSGADECIVRPISPALLLAKVKSWLRHSWTLPAESLGNLQVGGFLLDPGRRELTRCGETVAKLTNLQLRVLYLLMSHHVQALDSHFIVDRVWGYHGSGDGVLLKTVVYRLRRKIEPDPSQPRYIQTVAGKGYGFQGK